MSKKTLCALSLVLLLAALTGCSAKGPKITTGSLFREMVDMTALATYPNPSYKMVQYSSYDHTSKIPGGPGWFANSDGFGGEPEPNFEAVLKEPDESGIGEYLMADVCGPGAIVRFWTASINGDLQVYIDDMSKPLYEGKADAFFRRPYDAFAEMEGVVDDRFRQTVYQRDASYAPIPFAERLRMVWIGKVAEIHFYQVQVRLYGEDAEVVSFCPKDMITYQDDIKQVTETLADPDLNLEFHSDQPTKTFQALVPPGEKVTMLTLEGSGAVEKLSVRLKAENVDLALRQTVLHISCDGFPWGQVQSPVGDFFGAAPGINPYQSLPFTVKDDGEMICRFVMPFQESYEIAFENQGNSAVSVECDVLPMEYQWSDESMHFRARWRVDHNLVASNEDVQDLPFLLAHGKGVYVGSTSYLLNPAAGPMPWGNWWGEGDEKVFVDQDVTPSIFGTGSEDYYNYSWSAPDIFYFPYCGQPRNDGPGNRGFVTNYRYHILDPIPFMDNLRFYMELFHHQVTPGVSYARIGYHYARPGLTDDHQPLMEEDLRDLQIPEGWQPAAVLGSRNSTFHQAETVMDSKTDTQLRKGSLWADTQLLVWNPKEVGERKSFTLPIEQTGNKRIYITAAHNPNSGKVRVLLDGEPVSENGMTIDLHRPYRTLLRNHALEPKELERGEHIITLEYLGSLGRIQSPEIAIDFFWIQNI